ncbi:hypothetical protein FRC00_004164, partial [Tulasnella sp. 408]
MSTPEATASKTTNAQAVDEEYEKLERFHVDRRRVVFFKHQDPSQGGFGIVLRAELHESGRPRCTPTPANADHQTRSAALLENLGALESWKGNLEKSSAYLNEAMRLYQGEGDKKGICSVLRKQAAATLRTMDYVKVRAVASTALEHCKALNDALGVAEASYYLGYSLAMLSEIDEALPVLHESLDIRRTHGDEVGVVQCLERIADVLRAQGQDQDALSRLDEAVAIATRSGDRLGLADVLETIGYTQIQLSDFVKAAEALSEAIAINRSVG